MTRRWVYDDVTSSHADVETAANSQMYGVIGGCGVTLDASDLTFDVAAGAIMHNGTPITVAAQANAGTLVADASNPRYTLIYLDSSGTAGFTSGTAASSPAPPDMGDYVPLMLVRIAAAATIASSQTNYDHRAPILSQTWVCSSQLTKNANTTLADVTGVKFFVGASETWVFEANLQLSTGATPDIKVAFTVPSGAAGTGTYLYHATNAVASARVSDWTAAQSMTTAAAGTGALLTGRIVNSSTAGWVQLQAAQDTSDASDTIVYVGSWITARRVA